MKCMQTSAKKRKMLLVLPVLVIPFLTLAFYAMGGGRGQSLTVENHGTTGLNLQLPDARLKEDKLLDKLGFYDKAARDSAKKQEWMRSDPYYQEPTPDSKSELENLAETTAAKYNRRLINSPYDTNPNKPEDLVMHKLSLLEKELNKPTTQTYSESPEYSSGHLNTELPADVDRLEAMMNRMSAGEGEDPEIQQLSTVMDKILDVQHPSRVKERMKEKSLKESANAMTVSASSGGDTTVNGFYSLDTEGETKQFNAIEAVVNENQILVNGSVIKLRLLQEVFVGNQKISAGTFVFGIVGLNGERLQIEISSIRSGNSLFTVKMEVYDKDGLAGIHIPGAITRDVAKQSADNSLQMMELTTLDPSLKAQATAAGISTAKSLLSRKVKLVKVMVKAGYKVLLKDKASP